MLTNESPFAKKVALRAFLESLSKANATLAETKEAYRVAQEYHKTLTALVEELQKDGVALDEEAHVPHQQVSDDSPAFFMPNITQLPSTRKKGPVKKTKKVNIRDLIMESIKKGNVIVQTKEVLAMVRASQGKDYPAPTVSSSLARLVKDNTLHRVRNDKSNTSSYGLPEWFDGDVAKDEYAYGY